MQWHSREHQAEAGRYRCTWSPSRHPRCATDTWDMPWAGRQMPGHGACQSHPAAMSCVGAPDGNGVMLPEPSACSQPPPSPKRGKQKAKHQGQQVPSRSPRASRVSATPYLHSVTLQQQLPLRRPQRLERSSGLDFLRLKYSVSFPNEAMARAGVPVSLCTLVHATARPCPLPRAPPALRGSRARRTQHRAGGAHPRVTRTVHSMLQRAPRSGGC